MDRVHRGDRKLFQWCCHERSVHGQPADWHDLCGRIRDRDAGRLWFQFCGDRYQSRGSDGQWWLDPCSQWHEPRRMYREVQGPTACQCYGGCVDLCQLAAHGYRSDGFRHWRSGEEHQFEHSQQRGDGRFRGSEQVVQPQRHRRRSDVHADHHGLQPYPQSVDHQQPHGQSARRSGTGRRPTGSNHLYRWFAAGLSAGHQGGAERCHGASTS